MDGETSATCIKASAMISGSIPHLTSAMRVNLPFDMVQRELGLTRDHLLAALRLVNSALGREESADEVAHGD